MLNVAYDRAHELVQNAQRIVALTGAGFSRPSGIPDFRSPDGLWASTDPFTVATLSSFRSNPQEFYTWLSGLVEPMLNARPNPAHTALAELEQAGRLKAVLTQNIDGLHQQAGSRRVYELHGHLRSATCTECGRQIPSERLLRAMHRRRVRRCTCGGFFKPDVVLFDEALPTGLLWLARDAVETCDLLIVAGTALEVAPVCDLPILALRNNARILIVNLSPTYLDEQADLVLRADVAEALPAIVQASSLAI
jgi:NAD-dependent deacetylase